MSMDSELQRERAEWALQAARAARSRARSSRWTLETAVFLFAILIMTVILLFEGLGTAVVAPVAFFGLIGVWVVGWREGKQLYDQYYIEEMAKYDQNLGRAVPARVQGPESPGSD